MPYDDPMTEAAAESFSKRAATIHPFPGNPHAAHCRRDGDMVTLGDFEGKVLAKYKVQRNRACQEKVRLIRASKR